ncbi:polycomb group protein [Dionaea muscipula]
MCHQSCCPCISVEEFVPAEECLLVYCKPVELYNILQRRGQHSPSFLSRCLRYKLQAKSKTGLVDGSVIFNYKDQNDVLRKTEVTRNFSCPFCLIRCASFKGLRHHLTSSHDLFKFEFWLTEEYRAVNVSVKIDLVRSEILTNGIDPKLQSFCFCSKPRKRKRPEDPLENAKYVYPHALGSCLLMPAAKETKGSLERREGEEVTGYYPCEIDLHNSNVMGRNYCKDESGGANCLEPIVSNTNDVGVSVARAQSFEDMECTQLMSDQPAACPLVPNTKMRKLSLERLEAKSCVLLQKRQFYHSHRAQPMAMEQVLSDRDSEDEGDDDIVDLEDRRMLDDFVDVTKDEKNLMHLWNSFVRRQRVLADGHVPWACEAFLQLHGLELVKAPALFWCWRLFMVKLWNHGLLDACTMNNCSLILEKYQNEVLEDRKS